MGEPLFFLNNSLIRGPILINKTFFLISPKIISDITKEKMKKKLR